MDDRRPFGLHPCLPLLSLQGRTGAGCLMLTVVFRSPINMEMTIYFQISVILHQYARIRPSLHCSNLGSCTLTSPQYGCFTSIKHQQNLWAASPIVLMITHKYIPGNRCFPTPHRLTDVLTKYARAIICFCSGTVVVCKVFMQRPTDPHCNRNEDSWMRVANIHTCLHMPL